MRSSDLPPEEVRSKLNEVQEELHGMKQTQPDCTTAKGAEIWLVETFKDIEEWRPIARRKLSDVEWSWET